ncbi:MAG: lipoyl(octanoyl) transferase LipB [Planctomycetota bacterium]
MTRVLDVRRLGRTDYRECWELQRELVTARADGTIEDALLLTEHDAIVTVGRGTPPENYPAVEHPVVEVERGGEATYHGPGQLVAYPILALEAGRRDLHRYLRDLEEVVIGVLGEFGLVGERAPGRTGVWIDGKKICSIGIAVRRWVTYHGLALNLHNPPESHDGFRPCGLDASVMTRLADHCELPPTNLLGEVLLVKHFCRVFDRELPPPGSSEPDARGFPSLPLL